MRTVSVTWRQTLVYVLPQTERCESSPQKEKAGRGCPEGWATGPDVWLSSLPLWLQSSGGTSTVCDLRWYSCFEISTLQKER